ncbi:hypothetical protein FSARC_7836 [Fusarium sarcochroum]|uniref:DUF7779 domain-containing protein n=1 Tax=Fusarium sarcochroum TaxID=1208366 RepID=A0A8H4X6W1_9HYPO|nr:hypothetical protein FSARC_7836 [Fusarium sarcochroum]
MAANVVNIIVVDGVSVSHSSLKPEWPSAINLSDIPSYSFQVIQHSLNHHIRTADDILALGKADTHLYEFLKSQVSNESVLKRAYNLRFNDPACQRLVDVIAGFVFLATPHIHDTDKVTKKILSKLVVPNNSNRHLRRNIQNLALDDLSKLTGNFNKSFSSRPIFSAFEPQKNVSFERWLMKLGKNKIQQENLAQITTAGVPHEECVEIGNLLTAVQEGDSQLWQRIKVFLRRVCGELPLELSARYEAMEGMPPRGDKVYTDTATQSQEPNLNPALGKTPRPSPQSDVGQRDQTLRDVLPPDESSREVDLNIPCEYLDDKPKLPQDFFGRDEDLKLIDKVFLPNVLPETQADLNKRNVATYCLTGIGGVGKTRIAAEYATTRRKEFDVVCWVNTSNLLSGYTKFAAKLGLMTSTSSPEDSIVLNYVNTWFGRPVRNKAQSEGPFVRWLLIIDNVNRSDDLLPEHWPHEGRGAVLIVGRDPSNRTRSQFGTVGHEVEGLPPDKAISMLLQITSKSSEPSAAESAARIINIWGSIPLSLFCVAGVMEKEGMTLNLCAASGAAKRDELLNSTWRYAANKYNWAEIWALSSLPPSALTLLEIIALLEPGGIPMPLFRQSITVQSGEILHAKDMESSRKDLWQLALIGVDGTKDALTVPTVIQYTVLAKLQVSGDRLTTIYLAAVSLVSGYWPSVLTEEVNFSTRDALTQEERCEELNPHAERLIQIHQQELDEEKRSSLTSYSLLRLFLEYSWYMMDRQRFPKADATLNIIASYLEPSSDVYNKNIHVAYCTSRLRIANIRGDYTEALEFASQKLDLLKAIRRDTGKTSQKLCSAYTEKAMAWLGTGHHSEKDILPLLQTSIEIRQALPGFQQSQLFNAIRCEGTLYKLMGRLEDAKACYMRIYNDRIRELGEEESEHTNIRFVYWSGECELELGSFKEANEHLETALRIPRPGTMNEKEKARVLYALYEVANHLGNTQEADAYLQRACWVRAQELGPDDRTPDILTRDDFDQLRDPLE